MKAFLIYSLDGTKYEFASCTLPQDTVIKSPTPVSLEAACVSALTHVPVLFRTLEKGEAPEGISSETHVVKLGEFDLKKHDEKERVKLVKLLKCYYKRALDIQDGLTDERLDYVFDEWDASVMCPKLWNRILPKTSDDAVRWCTTFSEWFGEDDPVCKFWKRARKTLF